MLEGILEGQMNPHFSPLYTMRNLGATIELAAVNVDEDEEFIESGLLVRGSSSLFGQVKTRGATAVGDFRARPEHSRWRAYALGCYGLIVAATLAGQLYSSNPLGVYVKVQHVDIPVSTLIFVRNDSPLPWKHARIVVNGIYSHSRDQIAAGENVPLDLDRAFAVHDGSGKVLRRPPKNLPLQSLALDCDRGHYETELK